MATRSGGHYATNHTHIDDFMESTRLLPPLAGWRRGTCWAVVQAKLWPVNLCILDLVEACASAGLCGQRVLLVTSFESADAPQGANVRVETRNGPSSSPRCRKRQRDS